MPKIGTRTTTTPEPQTVEPTPAPSPSNEFGLVRIPDLGKDPGGGWTEKEVKMIRGWTEKVEKVRAWVYGQIAVWADGGEDEVGWEVSHIPTMAKCIWLSGGDKRDDALKIGELLAVKCSSCLSETDLEEARANRPEWTISWMERCKEVNGYVDP